MQSNRTPAEELLGFNNSQYDLAAKNILSVYTIWICMESPTDKSIINHYRIDDWWSLNDDNDIKYYLGGFPDRV